MAEITPPRIESIAGPGPTPDPQDQHPPKQRTKAAASGKYLTFRPPEIGAPEAEEKHELDEMA